MALVFITFKFVKEKKKKSIGKENNYNDISKTTW
jgi:hypothetical protein